MWPAERQTRDLSGLLQPRVVDQIGAEILNGGPQAIRYSETRADAKSMVFVAHRDDVISVLTNEDDFSLCHYNPLYSAVSPPGATIIMRPDGPERRERLAILRAAAAKTPWFGPDSTARHDVARACVDGLLASLRGQQRFDLIAEYGFFAPYLIATRVIGLGKPRSFSLLPLLICLANRHPVSRLLRPETGPYLTDVAWSQVVVAQLLINFENRKRGFRVLARFGASHLRKQIEAEVDTLPEAADDPTLLDALRTARRDFPKVKAEVYRDHVVSIMAEVASTILLIPGLGFTRIVDRCLEPGGGGLGALLSRLERMDPGAFVQEELRLAPPANHLLRTATGPIELGGLSLRQGEYVCAIVKSAGADVPDPKAVRGDRDPSAYLHFGPEGGPHRCFGHLIGPAMLAEMFLGLTRLPELTPMASRVRAFNSLIPGKLMVRVGRQGGTEP
jgi:cytochrome P450